LVNREKTLEIKPPQINLGLNQIVSFQNVHVQCDFRSPGTEAGQAGGRAKLSSHNDFI
jgi:hypothetical protein